MTTLKCLLSDLLFLLTELHSAHQNTDLNLEESEQPNEKVLANVESNQAPTNIPKKRQRSSYLKMLECEDIPHSEALLNSAHKNNVEGIESKTQKLTKPESTSADNIEDLLELRKKQLKARRNQMKMLPPFRRLVWPPNPMPYDRFNVRNPYNYFDCNYFLNPINDVGVPTIEYVYEDYDDAVDTVVDISKNNVKDKEGLKILQ